MKYISLPYDMDDIQVGDTIVFKELNQFVLTEVTKKTPKKANVKSTYHPNYDPSISKMVLIQGESRQQIQDYINVLNKLL